MRNLELKVRCADAAALDRLAARVAEGGAAYIRTLEQRDTYFAVPRGRLKLREWRRLDEAPPGNGADLPDAGPAHEDGDAGVAGAVLIAYDRPDQPDSRFSDYLLSPVPEPESLRAALTRALGVRVVVEKGRRLYRHGHTRIHLDLVTGLGAFAELETILGGDFGGAAAEREHRAVIALLGLDRLPPVAGSYSDLLEPSARSS